MKTEGSLAIIGAGGVLGAKLVERALATRNGPIYAYTHGTVPATPAATSARVTWAPLDITDGAAVAGALAASQPNAVINAAGMTNVDACEAEREAAQAANGAGPRHVADACVRLDAPLIHVSTDYVFPGDAAQPGPYHEDAPVRAVNVYGMSKLAGEQAVREVCAGRISYLVARTALMYGHIPGGRTNFVKWLLGELRERRRVKIVNDQFNTPTLADDVAGALLHLLARGSQGIIHVAGPDLLARDAWARAVANHFDLDTSLIDLTSTAELKQRAQRPLRSGLRTSRPSDLDGVRMRGVVAGLDALELE